MDRTEEEKTIWVRTQQWLWKATLWMGKKKLWSSTKVRFWLLVELKISTISEQVISPYRFHGCSNSDIQDMNLKRNGMRKNGKRLMTMMTTSIVVAKTNTSIMMMTTVCEII